MPRTRRRFLETGVLASLATVLAGCQGNGGDTDDGDGGGGDGTTQTTATDGGSDGGGTEVTVDMAGSQFDPRTLEVEVGTRVVWANEDSFGHTVSSASDNWSFDEEVGGGGSTAFTFDSSGVFDVYCRFHGGEDLSGMSMKVAVGGATIEDPLGGNDSTGDGDDTTTTGDGGGGGGGGADPY